MVYLQSNDLKELAEKAVQLEDDPEFVKLATSFLNAEEDFIEALKERVDKLF